MGAGFTTSLSQILSNQVPGQMYTLGVQSKGQPRLVISYNGMQLILAFSTTDWQSLSATFAAVSNGVCQLEYQAPLLELQLIARLMRLLLLQCRLIPPFPSSYVI
jgi:hypothetical protein